MASRNLFTEEGRTRFRNSGLRLRSYLIVFLILRLLVGGYWFANQTRGEMGALGNRSCPSQAVHWQPEMQPAIRSLIIGHCEAVLRNRCLGSRREAFYPHLPTSRTTSRKALLRPEA